ncbi:MAG: sporulation protein YunB [Ruminococcus sp.]|nr:sporulation protein YunB [Ruminococcus sp.]
MLIKHRKSRRKIRLILLAAAIIITVVLFSVESYLKPLQERLIVNRTKVVVEQKFSETVDEVTSGSDYDYDSLLIKSDSDKSTASLSVNTKELNRLESEFQKKFQERLDNLVEGYIEIPLGDLLEVSFMSGVGPDIPFSYDITGSVKVNLKSTFESTGINQTIHRINMEVMADIVFITVKESENMTINSEYQISETVLVGGTPDYFYKYE